MGKNKKYGIRDFINDVHLWLGLVSGIVLFLVCLSGTILTFEEEIEGKVSRGLDRPVPPGLGLGQAPSPSLAKRLTHSLARTTNRCIRYNDSYKQL